MGLYRVGPPVELLHILQENYAISTFIETGTFQGDTALWASDHFDDVYTIEFSKKIYKDTIAKFQNRSNINFLFGDSRSRISEIIPNLHKPALFWLDSHWCGGSTYGEEDQCPLLAEIEDGVSFDRLCLLAIAET